MCLDNLSLLPVAQQSPVPRGIEPLGRCTPTAAGRGVFAGRPRSIRNFGAALHSGRRYLRIERYLNFGRGVFRLRPPGFAMDRFLWGEHVGGAPRQRDHTAAEGVPA
jgi:hypothetical protein